MLKIFCQTNRTQAANLAEKGRFLSLWHWPLTYDLIFKLFRATDHTRLPCEFGANRFSGSRDISCTSNKQKTTDWRRQKQNLPQFTAGDNKCKTIHAKYEQYSHDYAYESTAFSQACDSESNVWKLFSNKCAQPQNELPGANVYLSRGIARNHCLALCLSVCLCSLRDIA